MNVRASFFLPFLTSMILAGCGGGSETGDVPLNKWLGEQRHLAISGTLQGKEYDVHLEGDAAASVYCDRFYAPLPGVEPDAAGNYDTSQLYFVMKELGAVIDLDGVPTKFTISYWRHDLAAGNSLAVIPRVFGTSIPSGQTWSDVNLFEPGTSALSGVEVAASSGSVSMLLNTGSTDAGGVMIPDGGRTGAFVSASWGPDEQLNVSATADCTPAQIAIWARARLLP